MGPANNGVLAALVLLACSWRCGGREVLGRGVSAEAGMMYEEKLPLEISPTSSVESGSPSIRLCAAAGSGGSESVLARVLLLRGGRGKNEGTNAQGRMNNKKPHILCRRCGRRSLHHAKKRCSSCGYPDTKMRKYNWAYKAKRRRTEGVGRMRYLKKHRKRMEQVRKRNGEPEESKLVKNYYDVMRFAYGAIPKLREEMDAKFEQHQQDLADGKIRIPDGLKEKSKRRASRKPGKSGVKVQEDDEDDMMDTSGGPLTKKG
mmetsp:Transcript_19809/g.35333  ORF Transcript_19809/g.35333 Transcript_19809/m.35333 type:complete len:260 (-) Transcript_19809:178-957(-)